MKSKIIFVEGLPNSGKSTSLAMINVLLSQQGFETKPMYEIDMDNNLDNHCNAYLSMDDFNSLEIHYPNEWETVKEVAESFYHGKLIRYWKHKKMMSQSLFKYLGRFDFYQLPLEQHFELVDEMWRLFLNDVDQDPKIYIVECALVQNPMHISLIRDNVDLDVFRNRVFQLCDRLKNYDSMLIYIDHIDAKNIYANRDKKSLGWQKANLEEYTYGNMYGRDRNLHDEKGLMAAYQDLYNIQKSLLEDLSMASICIDNTNYHLNRLNKNLEVAIMGFLSKSQ